MSPTDDSLPPAKKRKKDRACDACRRRKTKCDGPWMTNNICTNCIQTRKTCTYVEGTKPRGPPKAYVSGLEDRVEALEALLQQIRPDDDFSDELGPPVIRDSWKNEDETSLSFSFRPVSLKSSSPSNESSPILIPTNTGSSHATTPISLALPSSRTTHLTFRPEPYLKRSRSGPHGPGNVYRDPEYLSDDESSQSSSGSSSDTEEIVETSRGGRAKVTLKASESSNAEDNSIRFHGRNSTAGLVESTRTFKHMHLRELTNPEQEDSTPISPDNSTVAQTRRPKFWDRPPWEFAKDRDRIDTPESISAILDRFPPPDLADALIDIYFRQSNLMFPLLHRPTFLRQWREKLHHRNVWFTSLCASIFAVASRWCNDVRVLPEGLETENTENLDWTQAGKKYFIITMGIHGARRNLFHPASLFEVQTYTLAGMYLRGTSSFSAAWLSICVGIRKAQDVGAHRKKVYHGNPTVEEELWKRAFWHLVVFDRLGGASLGRACGVVEEDFDIDLPLEVDDEYWEPEDGSEPFKQPQGLPSSVIAFSQCIKMTQVMAFTLRTLYAHNRSRAYRDMIPMDRDSLMKQLSPAMADWLHELPEHLKWTENMKNSLFARQSATLMCSYYTVEVLIYRALTKSSPPTLSVQPGEGVDSSPYILPPPDPPTARCLQAAKSCARVVADQLRHGLTKCYVPALIDVAYICAGLLLVDAWRVKVLERELRSKGVQDIKPPPAQRIDESLTDVGLFLRTLEQARPRWDIVNGQLDALHESLAGLETPGFSPSTSTPTLVSESPTPEVYMKPQRHDQWSSASPQHNTESYIYPPSSTNPVGRNDPPIAPTFQSAHASRPHTNIAPPVYHPSPQNVAYPSSAGPLWSISQPPDYVPSPSESNVPPSYGRARAASIATTDVSFQYDARSLPYINSSMRRTSVPNLSARVERRSNEHMFHHSRVPSVQVYDMDGSVGRDDINMHYEGSRPPSTIRYAQPAYNPPRYVPRGGQDGNIPRVGGWNMPQWGAPSSANSAQYAPSIRRPQPQQYYYDGGNPSHPF